MNNNTFDIQRFGKLINRKWFDPKNYKLGSFVPAVVPILFLLIRISSGSNEFNTENRAGILLSAMVILIIFSPFIYFNNINHPKKGIIDAILPASTLEKFLVMQLTGLVYAPLFILITYGGVDSILSFIFPNIMGGYAIKELISNWNYNWENYLIIFGIFQFMAFCNLWFIKNKILKTAGTYAVFGGVLMIIAILFVKVFIENTHYEGMDNYNMNFSFDGNGGSLMIRPGDHPAFVMMQLARILMDIIMPIALTIGSYFMLKTRRY